MNRQKFSSVKDSFLQRRYGVSLGRRYVLAAASVVLFSVLGCSQVDTKTSALAQSGLSQPEPSLQKKTVVPNTKVVDANNKFAFKLFSEVVKQESNAKNISVSPTSVAIALAMTYNGASGSTQKAMAKTLELQGIALPELNSAYAELNRLLQNPEENVQLTIANSLWVNKNISLRPDFLQRNRDFYQAKVSNLDFQDPNATNIINNWVKDNTKGKINNIVDTIEPNQALFLINAIYFKGQWSQKFDKSQTKPQTFYAASGQQKQHPMMSQTGEYRYYETPQFQAVSLPYGQTRKVSLYIFLPKQNSNLKAFYQNLNPKNWDKWLSEFSQRDGSITLPRFQSDYETSLNDTLKALGMGEAFTNKADFSGIGDKLAISQVKHKTVIEVNEEGTEASAATSVGIVATSLRQPQPPFQMVVNRPFFYAIRDNQSKNILFMGSVDDPV
ncbi:Proteinase inhibitor I4, serpin [Nostoc sp. NIES-3756]|uniref:serpin family protein n=1 Tax=Nostoc sp. NIES-3756 TaxID=1751286 RepID=UPI00071EA86D|nr:serpin family protein [Nostoc sp. NIES-3756]BAT56022.1 Proteinase inhibitor I4, serpin [Nostoc sp. NIES-3756]